MSRQYMRLTAEENAALAEMRTSKQPAVKRFVTFYVRNSNRHMWHTYVNAPADRLEMGKQNMRNWKAGLAADWDGVQLGYVDGFHRESLKCNDPSVIRFS